MKKLIFFIFICMMIVSAPLKLIAETGNQNIIYKLDDPVLEQRAKEIGLNLRCLVCQNQSIEDSDAKVAKDLKKLIRSKIKDGKNDDEIVSYIHDRYGDFVLMSPPIKDTTYALWFAPFLILLIGIIITLRYLIKNQRV